MSGVDQSIEDLVEEISLEELDRRRRSRPTTPDSERPRCELCLALSVDPRASSIHETPGVERAYRCRTCGHNFDDPVFRDEPPALVGQERIERYDLEPRDR